MDEQGEITEKVLAYNDRKETPDIVIKYSPQRQKTSFSFNADTGLYGLKNPMNDKLMEDILLLNHYLVQPIVQGKK